MIEWDAPGGDKKKEHFGRACDVMASTLVFHSLTLATKLTTSKGVCCCLFLSLCVSVSMWQRQWQWKVSDGCCSCSDKSRKPAKVSDLFQT